MKATKAFLKSLIPNIPSRRIGQKPKTPSPPKAASTPASQKSNRAARGSSTSRSSYSSRTPELTDAIAAKQVKTPSKSSSATRERLEVHPVKTTKPQITGLNAVKLPPLKRKTTNLFNILPDDAVNLVLNKLASTHPQQIVLNNDFLNFYKEGRFKLHVSKKSSIEHLDRQLLSKLHTIYLNDIPITSEIIKILEKTITYSSITTIILNNVEFESDAVAASFFAFLRKNAPKLENLIIRASPKISNENIVKLISAIRELKKLVLLEFSGFDVRDAYKGTFNFDDMFINLLLNLPDLEYLVFNNNIIGEEQYRRLFISTYAISAPQNETYINDRYNMYLKSERMKFYDTDANRSARIPSYFFDLIKFRYADGKPDVQIYRDIFFFSINNMTNGITEGSTEYLEMFNTNPVLNMYRNNLLRKYPKKLAIPILERAPEKATRRGRH